MKTQAFIILEARSWKHHSKNSQWPIHDILSRIYVKSIPDSQYLYALINKLDTESICTLLKNIEEFFDSSFFNCFRFIVYFIPNDLYLPDLIA